MCYKVNLLECNADGYLSLPVPDFSYMSKKNYQNRPPKKSVFCPFN